MDRIRQILHEQFGIDCVDMVLIHGGLSATNYEIRTTGPSFFLKVYDKKKAQSSLWTENIHRYMPIVVWLNEHTALGGRMVRPRMTLSGSYRYDDPEAVYLLFDFIEGAVVGKAMTQGQLLEAAEIMACLHQESHANAVCTQGLEEDFAVPFCLPLEGFLSQGLGAAPEEVSAILAPCQAQLLAVNGQVQSLSRQMKEKDPVTVLCHTDAHGYNFMQSQRLILVDWEGLKRGPAEADLLMFTQKNYWAPFLAHYQRLRPGFRLDQDMLRFYILRRKVEDIWAFIEGLLYDDLSAGERQRDLAFLAGCCEKLGDLCFELS